MRCFAIQVCRIVKLLFKMYSLHLETPTKCTSTRMCVFCLPPASRVCLTMAFFPLPNTTLCFSQPTFIFRSKTTFVWCSQRFDTRNKRKMHTACNPSLAAYTTHHTKPAHGPHHSSLRRMCHLYSVELPPYLWSNSSSRIGSAPKSAMCINGSYVVSPSESVV